MYEQLLRDIVYFSNNVCVNHTHTVALQRADQHETTRTITRILEYIVLFLIFCTCGFIWISNNQCGAREGCVCVKWGWVRMCGCVKCGGWCIASLVTAWEDVSAPVNAHLCMRLRPRVAADGLSRCRQL